MKNIINKLIRPDLYFKPDKTNFLNEIYNGKETNRINKNYLSALSDERLKTERKIRNTGYFLNFLSIAFIVFVALLILLAIKH